MGKWTRWPADQEGMCGQGHLVQGMEEHKDNLALQKVLLAGKTIEKDQLQGKIDHDALTHASSARARKSSILAPSSVVTPAKWSFQSHRQTVE